MAVNGQRPSASDPGGSAGPTRPRALGALGLLDPPARESFDGLARLGARDLRVPVCLITLIEGDRHLLLGQAGLSEQLSSLRETPVAYSFCRAVIARRGPLVLGDARLDERLAGDLAVSDLGFVAYAGLPLYLDGECVGALSAIDTRPREWADGDLTGLSGLARLAANELALAATVFERHHRAATDALTGLPNRRAWDERLKRDLASARRLERPATVALLDMADLERHHGVADLGAGDELLKEFARRALALLREGDTLARCGREQFAVLLPDCPSESFAESILDRIRGAVPPGHSCSVGYASWDGREAPEHLMRRAGRALTRAKAMGRDRDASSNGGPAGVVVAAHA